MNLSVMSPVLNSMGLEDAIKYLSGLGVDSLELGAGGYPGKAHMDPEDFLAHPEKIEELKNILDKYNMKISAIACHGNPVHPNKETAMKFHNDFVAAMKVAVALGVETIITFSGCPGDCAESKNPNWVTCPWPGEYLEILDYQWNDVIIPYWKETAKLAAEIGIKKIAFEMHPGFCVYNPATLLKLREAVGDIIGANFDPSHLIWQGIDPVEAIRTLGDAIYFVHGKDVRLDSSNVAKNGVLDTKNYGDIANRSWVFRTMGYGHDTIMWKDIVSMLKTVGYDDVISIEHEDALMSAQEGLLKAIAFLKDVLVFEQAGKMWWA